MQMRIVKWILFAVVIVGIVTEWNIAYADWKIDLSRRQKTVQRTESQEEASKAVTVGDRTIMDSIFDSTEPQQEIVLLNTEKGFVPSSIRLKKGLKYMIHVVNVNDKEKNVSFVLDAFGEHHATYFGKITSFRLDPKKEGVYSFQCPETSLEGRLTVINPPAPAVGRVPASEDGR